MFYFEGIVDNNGIKLPLNKAYCNLIVSNDGLDDILIYDNNNYIGRIKSGEQIEFRGYQIFHLEIKGNNVPIRLWAW
jgi:hypothetical protein